jgi:hypothetical protein
MPRSSAARLHGAWIALLASLAFGIPSLAFGTPNAPTSSHPAGPTSASAERAQLSQYERDVLGTVLTDHRLELEPRPEGKSIESIEVVPLEVFEPADPLPGWTNWFHTTSRAAVIEREVLVRPGQPYDQRLLDESARNLRNLKQLSLVLIVPVRAKNSDRVTLLVVTKDVWSLRLNSSFSVRNSTIEYLMLEPSEENLAGTHLRIAGLYAYDLSTNTFGGAISHRRLWGSRIRVDLRLNAIQYRRTGQFEGSSGTFLFAQPLYSTHAQWAWGTSLSWLNRVSRPLLPDPSGAYAPRLYRDPNTPSALPIPYQYRSRQLVWQTAVTRSFGYEQKSNLSFGLETVQRNFDAHQLVAEGYPADAVQRFEQHALERKYLRIGPFAMLETYRNAYVSMFDIETLGLQEDISLGPRAFVKVYSGTKRALATSDLVGVTTGLQYSATLGGSLMRLWTTHTTEVTPRHASNDGLVQGGVRLVSPRLGGIGRFVYDGGALYHYQNSRNLRFALGGDTRLRGYPSEQFLGHHLVTSNLEFRSRSLKIMEVLFGLVGFYEVGDAFDAASQLHPKSSIGFGGRATFPQFQRVVGRLDVAFPLTPPTAGASERWNAVAVFLTLDGQAFPFPVAQSASGRTALLTPPD